jgi:ABC-type lipoprotein release transport system permease subunit
MRLLILAWKNLFRNKRRTLITLAAMSFSLMLVQGYHNFSLGAYRHMVESGVRTGSGHIAVYRGDYAASRDEKLSYYPGNLIAEITRIHGVRQVLPRVYFPGMAQSSRASRGILLTGVDPRIEPLVNPFLKNLPSGQMIRSSDGRDALVGSKLLQELKIGEGGKFVVTVQNRQGELVNELFRVRGTIHTGIRNVDDSLVMVGRQRAAAMGGIPGSIHELAVVLGSANADRSVLPLVERLLRDKAELAAVPWEKAMPNLYNAIRWDYVSTRFVFVVILLIVTIGVVNTLLMSVLERIREFGVILALGATPGRLRRMILTEALLLGSVSLVIGTLLGSLITWYLAVYGIDLRFLIPENIEFGGVVFSTRLHAAWDLPWMARIAMYVMVLCLAASFYPAMKAARISPVKAMRHV